MRVRAVPRLNKKLKEIGWTQRRLAQESGVSPGAVSRFDKNSRHEADHLFSIAHTLGIKVEDLFEITIEDDKNDEGS